jgi:hypothetical protein
MMPMRRYSLLALLLALPLSRAGAQPRTFSRFSDLGLPAEVRRSTLERMLQRFVDTAYSRAFRHLGDERDFDHGHLLFDSRTGRPAAILYHTQELAKNEPPESDYSYIDPEKRNWLQWLDGRLENANTLVRRVYPAGASWRWFEKVQLPDYVSYHTVVPKMLDADRLGIDDSRSQQWVFTRQPCSAAPPADDDPTLVVRLPTSERVCLALSR